ncbi:hypothetical protein L6R29_25895 [Myxococcota bacterium]|nr:hypothetical protein [Myxococcota bacterium]
MTPYWRGEPMFSIQTTLPRERARTRGFWTLHFGFWTLHFGFWTLHFGFWTLHFGFWTFVTEPSSPIFRTERFLMKKAE